MKRILLIALGLLLIGALSACSGDVYSLAYSARGDSTNLLGVTQTEQFRDNEDLNVIVKLNEHDGTTVSATFFAPDGTEVSFLETEVDSETGTVLLGLDYQDYSNGNEEVTWPSGTWRVEIRVNGENVDEVTFRVT